MNVLGDNAAQTYYMVDSLNTATVERDYYKENDIAIGAELNIFGRKVIITDLDAFTKEYYR